MTRETYAPESLRWYSELLASPAVRAGDLVFVAGQVAADAAGETLAPGDVKARSSA